MKFYRPIPLVAALLLATATLFLAACTNVEEEMPAEIDDQVEAPVVNLTGEITDRTDCSGTDVHWEYEGIDGPDHWDELCDAWACDDYAQSPVNIIPPLVRTLSRSLYFYWKPSATHIVNNGHTLQFNYDQASNPNQGSYLTLNGSKYHLLQFHFHTESEHTVNGEHYPAEVHFVHRQASTGKLAVIGVFLEEGASNPFLASVLDHLPHDAQGTYNDAATYNASALTPSDMSHFWYYGGSLTTPPCSESVNWMVMNKRITASAAQLHELEEIMGENNRPIQPLNSRLVKAQ